MVGIEYSIYSRVYGLTKSKPGEVAWDLLPGVFSRSLSPVCDGLLCSWRRLPGSQKHVALRKTAQKAIVFYRRVRFRQKLGILIWVVQGSPVLKAPPDADTAQSQVWARPANPPVSTGQVLTSARGGRAGMNSSGSTVQAMGP